MQRRGKLPTVACCLVNPAPLLVVAAAVGVAARKAKRAKPMPMPNAATTAAPPSRPVQRGRLAPVGAKTTPAKKVSASSTVRHKRIIIDTRRFNVLVALAPPYGAC